MVRYANVDLDVQDKSLYNNMHSEIHIIDNRSYQLNEVSHTDTWLVFGILSIFSVVLPFMIYFCSQGRYSGNVAVLRKEQGLEEE